MSGKISRRAGRADRQLTLLDERPATPGRSERSFRVTGLFAGIGGLELGMGQSGHESDLLCELDSSANAVLDARFPGARRHADVCSLLALPRSTEVVTAGFPCQDLSQAGKTKGISGARSGLVGEVFRLIEKRRVPWVILENVPFMLQLAKGEALEVIVAALEHLQYKWAYRVLDSRAFGIPQRRERVYLVASRFEDPRNVLLADDAGPAVLKKDFPDVACGFYWTEGVRGLGWAVDAVPTLKGGSTIGIPSPPAIIFPDGRVMKPDIRDCERLQGFAPDWTRPAEESNRKTLRWKLVGNAVTTNVPRWLGQRLATPGEFRPPEGVRQIQRGGSWPRVGWNVGDGRFTCELSSWPVRTRSRGLEAFLKFPTEPLSQRATAGFLSRTAKSSLRFPPGFIDALKKHLEQAPSAAAA